MNYAENIRKERIGTKNVMSNGQIAEIIKWRTARDIDVQFEDGTVVCGREYTDFCKGYIANPNFTKLDQRKKEFKGKRFRNKCGHFAVCADIPSLTTATVVFEGETKEVPTSMHRFKNKNIKHEDCKNKPIPAYILRYVGQKNIAHNGEEMEIIAARERNDIDIRFADGTIVTHRAYVNFRSGYISKKDGRRKSRNG